MSMILHFKDGKTGSYLKETLSALFHLVRNFVKDFPGENDLPLGNFSREDFEAVLDAYREYYLIDSSIQLTENQSVLAEFIMAQSIENFVLLGDAEHPSEGLLSEATS